MPTLRMEARRQRIWIPACAGMTKGDVASWGVKRVAPHFVIPAQAGIQGSASAEAIGYAARWTPACAGMTKVGAITKGAGEARP